MSEVGRPRWIVDFGRRDPGAAGQETPRRENRVSACDDDGRRNGSDTSSERGKRAAAK